MSNYSKIHIPIQRMGNWYDYPNNKYGNLEIITDGIFKDGRWHAIIDGIEIPIYTGQVIMKTDQVSGRKPITFEISEVLKLNTTNLTKKK